MKHSVRGWHGHFVKRGVVGARNPREALIDQAVRNVVGNHNGGQIRPGHALAQWLATGWRPNSVMLIVVRDEFSRLAVVGRR